MLLVRGLHKFYELVSIILSSILSKSWYSYGMELCKIRTKHVGMLVILTQTWISTSKPSVQHIVVVNFGVEQTGKNMHECFSTKPKPLASLLVLTSGDRRNFNRLASSENRINPSGDRLISMSTLAE
jgi:hypothetical protein